MYLTVFVSGIYHLFGGLEGSFVILINDCVLTDTLTAKCPSECSQQMITLMRRQDTTARAIPSRRSQTTTKKQLNSITNTTTPKTKKKTNKPGGCGLNGGWSRSHKLKQKPHANAFAFMFIMQWQCWWWWFWFASRRKYRMSEKYALHFG